MLDAGPPAEAGGGPAIEAGSVETDAAPTDTTPTDTAPADTASADGAPPDAAADAGSGPDAPPPSSSLACPAPAPEMCLAGAARCGGSACVSLNSDQNCGRCGRTCGDSLCQAFDCERVSIPDTATCSGPVAVSDTALYWATMEGGIKKRTFANPSTTAVAANEGMVMALVADDRAVYFMNKEGLTCPSGGCLWRLSLDGGARESLADVGLYPGGLTQDAEAIYWFTYGAIVRLDKAGPPARQEIATGQGSDGGLAVDDEYVYWGSDSGGDGLIKRAPKKRKEGEGPTALVRGLARPHGIAVDGAYVYWTDRGTRFIQRAPRAGGDAVMLASHMHPLQEPMGIAVTASDVYWSLSGGNINLYRVPRCGGETRVVADGNIGGTVPGKEDVFWCDIGVGIFRIRQ